MDKIIFKKEKAFLVSYDEEKEHQEIDVEGILPHLGCEAELEEGTLFQHVWAWIERDAEIMGIIFSDAMGRHNISDFIEQFHKPSRPKEIDEPSNHMEYLQLSWQCEIEQDNNFWIVPDFCGIGPHAWKDVNGKTVTKPEQGWGLTFTPINDLKGYPLKLREEFSITQWYETDEEYGENHSIVRDFGISPKTKKTDTKIIAECERGWTVYDIIYGILFEITFHGSPKKQIKQIADMDQKLAEAKDWAKENLINEKEQSE